MQSGCFAATDGSDNTATINANQCMGTEAVSSPKKTLVPSHTGLASLQGAQHGLKLKQFGRTATRYVRLSSNLQTMLRMMSAVIWLV